MTQAKPKKKVLKKKLKTKPTVSDFATPVVESAREIWLAGLGAFSVAQAESGKLIEQGNKLFDKLVSEGTRLEKKSRDVAETAVGDIREEVEAKVGDVRQQAVDKWDKLETVFEDRVASALGRLGVPTAEEVNKLSAHVQKLSSQVAALSKSGTARATTRRKSAARKPAAANKTK